MESISRSYFKKNYAIETQLKFYLSSGYLIKYKMNALQVPKMVQIFSATCTSSARLDGKTVIITGANTGIGKCTAQDFYLRGGRVLIACRSLEKAEAAISDIKKNCEGKPNLGSIITIELDLTSLESIRNCAAKIIKEEQHINILVNNAGIMGCPEGKTKDGFETQIGTNHFGHFFLTLLLLPKIIESAPARIVNVSSMGHNFTRTQIDLDDINWEKRPYNNMMAYYHSKIANILFTKELARRLEEAKITGVTTYALHPGVVASDMGRHLHTVFIPGVQWLYNNVISYLIKTPEQGSQTSIYCSVDEDAGKENGLYYAECKVKEPNANAQNAEDAKKLWDISVKLVGLEDYDPFSL